MVVILFIAYGITVGRKKVGTMMKMFVLDAIQPKKRRSIPNKGHKIYPYRLKKLKIDSPNMVWSADITYIWLNK